MSSRGKATDTRDAPATLRAAIVGHTNTGKTSLIRTLLRDENFGEIADASGTTRSVARTAVLAGDREVLALYDTPGFEDSSALLDAIEHQETTATPDSPAQQVRDFVAQASVDSEFEQENKVLLQALHSDVLLYIIDVREPLLGKYIDEVSILSKCGKPIIPVFNFIADNAAGLQRWREKMAEFNLHAALEFDTVAFDFEAEKRLYQKLQSVLEPHYGALQALIDYRQQNWENLSRAAAQRIFDLLRQVACYRQVVDDAQNDGRQAAAGDLQHFVRKAEQRTLRDLLRIFSFSQVDIELQQLPVKDGEWDMDIFSPAALKAFGLNAGSSALTGAAAGAGVDLMVGGLSLGAATLVGAALGAGLATVRRYKQELQAAWRGKKWLCVDDNTIALLYLRQRELLQRLTRRGHAAQGALTLGDKRAATTPPGWADAVSRLRQHPEWQSGSHDSADYRDVKSTITGWLLAAEPTIAARQQPQ